MHKTIGYLSKRVAPIRPGETRKVLLTFAAFFFLITACYILKPVGRSLALGALGTRGVPGLDLICVILIGPVVTGFIQLAGRIPLRWFLRAACGLMIGALLACRPLLQPATAWVSGVFYVWAAIFGVLAVSLFWRVANALYRPREITRLFGLIGSGGILGGIAGSFIAAVAAQLLGTTQLPLCAAAALALCWALIERLWRFLPLTPLGDAARAKTHRESFLSDAGAFAKFILHSRYLFLLVAVVGFGKLASTLISYQLNPFIERFFPFQDARTTFLGVLFGGMNIAAFLIQFGLTSWTLRRGGVLAALLVLPLGALAGTAGVLAAPALWLAASTELFDGATHYSLHQSAKEACYLAIDRTVRGKVKAFIDLVVYRAGKGLAAVIGLLLLAVWRVPPTVLSWVAVLLIAAWIAAAIQLRREYVTTIRTMLQARAASRRDDSSASRKLALLQAVVAAKGSPRPEAKELLDALTAHEARPSGVTEGRGEAAGLKAVIGDPRAGMAERTQAIRRLARDAVQDAVDYLFGVMVSDAALRAEALRALVRLRPTRLEFPADPIRRQIAQEVARYTRVRQVAALYHRHHRGPLAADDGILALLRVLLEESVEQVFLFLTLLYRPDEIRLAYEQLRAPEARVRADALECLERLVDPAVRAVIFPILDEDRFLSALDEEPAALSEPSAAYRLLQGAMWDRDCWLSVTTLCAVGRMRLTVMREELEKASRHSVPMIASAAKVALQLEEP